MAKKMLIDATHSEETRVVVVQGNRLDDFDFESTNKQLVTGNIYLAKVTRVEPSLQAAFVDFGGNRHGFLAFSEIHPDYYQIPVADREALLAEEMEDSFDEDEDDGDNDSVSVDAKEQDQDEDSDERPRQRRRRPRRRRGRDREKEVVEIEIETGGVETSDGSNNSVAGEESSKTSSPDIEAAAENESGDNSEEVKSQTPSSETETGQTDKNQKTEKSEPSTEDQSPEETTNGDIDTDDKPKTILMASDVRGDSVSEGDDPKQPENEEHIVIEARSEAEPDDGSNDEAISSSTDKGSDDGSDGDVNGSSSDPDGDDDESGDEGEGDNVVEADDDPSVGQAEDVETDAGPETEEEVAAEDNRRRRQKRQARRRYKIQEVIKRRQIILVQVVKEERGNKGAALTTYLSLAGRYCVLMPNTARGGGISRKISNVADRKRLKSVVSDLEVARGMGLIVRTAGANRTKGEIRRDYEYLLRLWESVRTLTLKSVAPSLVYEEGNLIKRSIRDLYSKDIDSILVQGERGYREAKDFMRMIMPSHAKHVNRYKDRIPLYHRYQVETQLESMYSPVVQLKSGGYLVINPTEALVSIDINSGKSTKEHNIEDTAVKTNLEAAEEISRQLRLRDLAGLIVIDFIDMEENRNTRAVERKLKDSLKHDRARIQVGRISSFGLLEMSRQRLRQGVVESSTHECPHCRGTGRVRSVESCALHVIRALEEECIRGRAGQLKVSVTSEVAIYLLNQKRHRLTELENRYRISILVDIDNELIAPAHSIERMKGSLPRPTEEEEVIRADSIEFDELEDQDDNGSSVTDEDSETEDDEGNSRRRRRRRRRRGERSAEEKADNQSADDSEEGETTAKSEGEDSEDENDGRNKRRRRGNRNKRRRGRRNEEETATNTSDDETGSTDNPDTQSENSDEVKSTEPKTVQEHKPDVSEKTIDVEEKVIEKSEKVETADAEAATSSDGKEATGATHLVPNETETETETDSAPAAAEPKSEAVSESRPRPRKTGWWSRRFGGEN